MQPKELSIPFRFELESVVINMQSNGMADMSRFPICYFLLNFARGAYKRVESRSYINRLHFSSIAYIVVFVFYLL